MHINFCPKKMKKMKTTCPPTLLCVFVRLSSFIFLGHRRRIMFLPLPLLFPPPPGGRVGGGGLGEEQKKSQLSQQIMAFLIFYFLLLKL